MMKPSLVVFILCFFSHSSLSAAGSNEEISEASGASIFQYRCALCHGVEGYGDGILSVSLKGYPPANLHKNKFGTSPAKLRNSIMEGGSKGKMSEAMPPWGSELEDFEVESLLLFLGTLYQDPGKLKSLVESVTVDQTASVESGKKLYNGYCSLCHGATGQGDGKMSRIIKDPPPFNLTESVVPADYLQMIIERGGEPLGRSSRMPPWEEQFTKSEIDSIIRYLLSIRQPG